MKNINCPQCENEMLEFFEGLEFQCKSCLLAFWSSIIFSDGKWVISRKKGSNFGWERDENFFNSLDECLRSFKLSSFQ